MTDTERLILIQLLEIRAALNPSDGWGKHAKELICGYPLTLSVGATPMTTAQVELVLDTLQMYRCLHNYFEDNPSDDLGNRHGARFVGFDGNGEGDLYGYCRYLIFESGLWQEQLCRARMTDGFNSHVPMAAAYARAVYRWKQAPSDLTSDDVRSILDHFSPPSV